MKGKLHKEPKRWVVKYPSFEGIPLDTNPIELTIPVHPDDADDNDTWFEEGKEIEFTIGDFMGSSQEFARLKSDFVETGLECAINLIIRENEGYVLDELACEETTIKIMELLKKTRLLI